MSLRICDTTQAVEILLNLNCESRQEVDDLMAKALAAGGTTYDKAEDFGFMYTHSFLDPDGHGETLSPERAAVESMTGGKTKNER